MTQSVHEYATVLADLHDRYTLAQAALIKYGPAVIIELMEYISLREIGRRCGLSPTYLSRVKTGDATISVRSFVQIVELLANIEGKESPCP